MTRISRDWDGRTKPVCTSAPVWNTVDETLAGTMGGAAVEFAFVADNRKVPVAVGALVAAAAFAVSGGLGKVASQRCVAAETIYTVRQADERSMVSGPRGP